MTLYKINVDAERGRVYGELYLSETPLWVAPVACIREEQIKGTLLGQARNRYLCWLPESSLELPTRLAEKMIYKQ